MAHSLMRRVARASLVLGLVLAAAPALAGNRTITFTNHCTFDVWMTSVGSNAGTVACSPSTADAQGTCPAGDICYSPDANTHYCVPGTTTAKTFPIAAQGQITLDPSLCPSGAVVTDTGSPLWGQCTCATNSNCASGQICKQAAQGINQCYWQLDLPGGGHIAMGGKSLRVPVTVGSTQPNALVASGKVYAKLACNDNGVCLSDNSVGAPASLVEFTFQNDNDWYDVSYINGVNVPMAMYPAIGLTNDYQSSDPYRCQPAGGDDAIYTAIINFQKANGLTPNTALQGFVCTNDYASRFTGDQAGFNFVSADTGAATCSKAMPCTGQDQVCGLTLSTVTAGGTQTQCGHRLGYWTYAQFCAAPGKTHYANTTLGIACDQTSDYAYALCKNQPGLADTGPGRSCFNSTTTQSGDTCCGFETWTAGSATQPMGKGDSAVSGVVTSDWKTAVLSQVRLIKEGCYLAYSYQFDDPYSTFTCASRSGLNAVNYQVDLCPGGNTAGVQPPTVAPCVAQVPSGNSGDELTIGIGDPSSHSYVVHLCDATGSCTSLVNPTATDIYTAAAGTNTYLVTATNTGSQATESCKFEIPQTGCIVPLNRSGDCATWSVATTGAWSGRSIQIPAF